MHRMRRVLIYERHLPSKMKTGKKHFRCMLRGRKMASGANSSAPPRNCFHFLKWKHVFLRGNPLQSQQDFQDFYITLRRTFFLVSHITKSYLCRIKVTCLIYKEDFCFEVKTLGKKSKWNKLYIVLLLLLKRFLIFFNIILTEYLSR